MIPVCSHSFNNAFDYVYFSIFYYNKQTALKYDNNFSDYGMYEYGRLWFTL